MYHISQIQGMVLITATLKISLAKSQLPQVNICIDTSATQSIKSDVVVDRQSQSPEVSDHEEPNPWVHVLNSQFTGIMGNVWNRIHVYIYIYTYIICVFMFGSVSVHKIHHCKSCLLNLWTDKFTANQPHLTKGPSHEGYQCALPVQNIPESPAYAPEKQWNSRLDF